MVSHRLPVLYRDILTATALFHTRACLHVTDLAVDRTLRQSKNDGAVRAAATACDHSTFPRRFGCHPECVPNRCNGIGLPTAPHAPLADPAWPRTVAAAKRASKSLECRSRTGQRLRA